MPNRPMDAGTAMATMTWMIVSVMRSPAARPIMILFDDNRPDRRLLHNHLPGLWRRGLHGGDYLGTDPLLFQRDQVAA